MYSCSADHPSPAQQYDVPGGFSETYMKNSKRLAEVWMDDYKEVYYRVRPSARDLEVGVSLGVVIISIRKRVGDI